MRGTVASQVACIPATLCELCEGAREAPCASAGCILGAIVCGTGYTAIGRLRRPYKVSNEDEYSALRIRPQRHRLSPTLTPTSSYTTLPGGDGREKEDAGDDRPHGLSLATCPTCATHKTYNDDRDSARSTRDTGDKYTILLRLC
ncbi:hypothetical protein BD779DRAFT_1472149 [Infundibulicybe gibba]|nr:hypothetical protein BD779DRAFT_1472149 [Infundibulicybe gibba]